MLKALKYPIFFSFRADKFLASFPSSCQKTQPIVFRGIPSFFCPSSVLWIVAHLNMFLESVLYNWEFQVQSFNKFFSIPFLVPALYCTYGLQIPNIMAV